jgi:hypothetical protein
MQPWKRRESTLRMDPAKSGRVLGHKYFEHCEIRGAHLPGAREDSFALAQGEGG